MVALSKATLNRKDLFSAVCYVQNHARCTGRIVNPRNGGDDIEMDCMCSCHAEDESNGN